MFRNSIATVLLTSLMPGLLASAADNDTTVALTATISQGGEQQQRDLMAALLDLLELEVSAQPGLAVVERRQIDFVLHELALSEDIGRNDASRLQLGKIASADLILTLELKKPEQDDESPRVLIRIVESLTGIIRGVSVTSLDEARVDEVAIQIARYLAMVNSHPERPPVTVAVAPFESKGRFDRLRPLERGLRDMTTTRLLKWSDTIAAEKGDAEGDAARGFQVLQRSGMEELLRELELIQSALVDPERLPATLPTRAAAFLVQGTVDEKNEDGEFRIVISGQLIHAASNRVVRDFEFETKPDGLEVALAHQVDLFAGRLMSSTDEVSLAPGKLREIHEVDSLFENTLQDLRRFRRRRPIDFSYRDFALRGKVSGPPVVKADGVLGQAILKKSIDRLEAVLLIQPENMQAAYALGYCLAFHIDGIWQPERADKLLRKVGAASEDNKLRADALRLLAEISFHHWEGGVDPKLSATAANQIVHALINIPEEHRDSLWARITELLRTTLPSSQDAAVVKNLLEFAKTQADVKDSRHRARFASLAFSTAELLKKLDPGASSEAAIAMENLLDGEDLEMVEMAARRLAADAQKKKDYAKAAFVYQKAAGALAANGTESNRFKANNLNVHAARCLRQADQHEQARTLLESFEPVNPTSLNAGYRAVQLGQCYMHDGENERALELLVNAAEQCRNLVDNSDVVKLIEQLGGVPLRDDREIDVEYVKGENGQPVIGRVLATDGSRLFCAGGFREGIAAGVLTLDPTTGTWTTLSAEFGRVMDMTVRDGHLWVATETDGLWVLDLATQGWTAFSTQNGLPDDRISQVMTSAGATFAGVGTRGAGGVVRINASGTVEVLDSQNAPNSVPISMALDADRLVVTTQPSLHELDLKTGEWTIIKDRGRWFANVFTGENNIWASRYKRELVPYDADDQAAERFQSAWFSGDGKAGYTVAFVIEHGGQIWFGGDPLERFRSAGFYRIDPKTGAFKAFNLRDGFRQSVTYSTYDGVAIGDSLWLATSSGIAEVTIREPTDAAKAVSSESSFTVETRN